MPDVALQLTFRRRVTQNAGGRGVTALTAVSDPMRYSEKKDCQIVYADGSR
jgi:hypothetical protein